MKKLFTILFFSIALFSKLIFSQDASWQYAGEVKFPDADTGHVSPYMVSVDENGRLWTISSKVLTVSSKNAIFYADSNDTELKKFIDFDENGDSDTLLGFVGQLRGLGTIGTDVFITSTIPFKHFNNTLSTAYRYRGADTNRVEKWGYNLQGAGYGTHIHGAALTRDTFLVTGITYLTSIRLYNFNATVGTPAYGSWVSMPGAYPLEPGGPHTNGFDIIRDVATIPGADYTSPETAFYTVRNSLDATNQTGGIAVWTGGDQLNPANYTGTRVIDQASLLALDKNFPYGITVDNRNKYLWVAGTDSTRKWVKGFEVTINFADFKEELPSATDPNNPNPAGAPFGAPSDVALSKDGLTAYVADYGTRAIYKFKYGVPNGINDDVTKAADFRLKQNFPNPFNPSTMISYTIPKGTNVKLVVTNTLGQVVATLLDSYQIAGSYSKVFNASDLSSSVYYYTISTDAGSLSKKMLLMK